MAKRSLSTAPSIYASASSIYASGMLFRSLAQGIIPNDFYKSIWKIFSGFSNQVTMVIHEYDGLVRNQIYEAAEIYLSSKLDASTDQTFSVSKPETEKKFTLKMEGNEEIIDIFNNVKFKWVFVRRQAKSRVDNNNNYEEDGSMVRSEKQEVGSFEVSYPKNDKAMALESYLPHILKEAKSVLKKHKTLKIFTMYPNGFNMWKPINLDHPATFDTLAIEPDLKDRILKDLDRFVQRKHYYRTVGKAWKRGYLLYGPPGTGKSSLIAAIANYLNFDVYDLELTQVNNNTYLRRVLLATANRSILVVEDIDCTLKLDNRLPSHQLDPSLNSRVNKVTLSGFLNFIDGLWSSCGDERIIIFTTNHKEKLDPALLRPGRMDFHVHMSYCTPCGFRVLASNYLGIKEHILFKEIEDLIRTIQVTPAELAEQLMRSDEVETVLNELIEFLKVKKKENEDDKKNQEERKKKAKCVIKEKKEEEAKCDEEEGEEDDDEN